MTPYQHWRFLEAWAQRSARLTAEETLAAEPRAPLALNPDRKAPGAGGATDGSRWQAARRHHRWRRATRGHRTKGRNPYRPGGAEEGNGRKGPRRIPSPREACGSAGPHRAGIAAGVDRL